jgi:hypothetical protein
MKLNKKILILFFMSIFIFSLSSLSFAENNDLKKLMSDLNTKVIKSEIDFLILLFFVSSDNTFVTGCDIYVNHHGSQVLPVLIWRNYSIVLT